MTAMPATFISHGAPSLALEPEDPCAAALRKWGGALPRPDAIVVMSAHWETPGPIRITSGERTDLIYDFAGFPEPLYSLTYPAPGAPGLAAEIGALLEAAGIPARADESRGWDHGVWVPLRLAFPEAAIPVVELSLPRSAPPEELARIGRALRMLRRRGILLVGSGGVVHNLRLVRFPGKNAPPDAWAVEFDRWVSARLAARDFEGLARYRADAPGAELAVPTSEHFDPIFFVLGASAAEDDLETIHEGFHYGNLSMRCFALHR